MAARARALALALDRALALALALALPAAGCSDDGGGGTAAKACVVHEECALARGEVCDREAGRCRAHGLCTPSTDTRNPTLHCPEDMICQQPFCRPRTEEGDGEGEGPGPGPGPGPGGGEGEGEVGPGPGGEGEGEGEGEGGPGPGGEGEGPVRPPPVPGVECQRHDDCQGGRVAEMTCKRLSDAGPKRCTTVCTLDADCPAVVLTPGGAPVSQCCKGTPTGRFCGQASLCLDPTECIGDGDCPDDRVCFDRPDLGAGERRCHAGAGLGGACPGGFLDCNPDLTDRCVYDRDLRRAYCTHGCVPPDPLTAAEGEGEDGEDAGGCPAWACCGDAGLARRPEDHACLLGGAERCDLAGRDCDSRDDGHDLQGEPDDRCEAPRALDEDGGFQGVLCPGDEDWSYIEVALGRSVHATLTWRQPTGAPPPSFELRTETCQFLGEAAGRDCRADPSGLTETCTTSALYKSPDPGRYLMAIEAPRDAEEMSYTLTARAGCLDNSECRRRPDVDRQLCQRFTEAPGVCVDGFPCVTNDDCVGSRVCNQADQSCVEVCEPDRYDQGAGNNRCGGPAIPNLSQPGAGEQMTLCRDDEDWFVVGLAQGDGLQIDLDYAKAAGPLVVAIWSTDCRLELRTSSPDLPATRARLEAAPVGGNYYIKVSATAPGIQNAYAIVPTVRPGGYCRDDESEDDDVPADALRVRGLETGGAPVALVDRKSCEGDDDWYVASLLRGESLSVYVDSPFGGPAGDLDVEVFGPGLAAVGDGPLAAARTAAPGEELHVQVPADGDYYVRLAGGLDMAYGVRFERAGAPCDDDGFEPNDRPSDAEVVVADPAAPVVLDARFCGGSEDWWKVFWLRRGGLRAEVCVDDPLAGDLDLALYRAGQEGAAPLAESAQVQAPCEVVDVEHLPAEGDYTLRVWSRERPQASYTLTLSVVAPCDDPLFEPNDVNAGSRELQAGEYRGLRRCDGDEDWFHIAKEQGASLWIDVLTPPDAPPLHLDLYNRTGASPLSQPDAERPGQYGVSSVDAFFGQNEPRYKVRVWADDPAAVVDYDLLVVVRPKAADCADADPREPMDSSFARAEPALPGIYEGGHLCAGDRDHFPVAVPEGGRLSAELALVHADGDLTLTLWAPDGRQELARSATAGDIERVAMPAPAAAAGRYVVRVEGRDGGVANGYALRLTVD